MAMIHTLRKFFWVLTTLMSMSVVVLVAEYIRDDHHYQNTTPPAGIALLVAAILHTLWYFYILVNGRKHRASTILAGILLVWTFYLASLIAWTVLRNEPRYCPPSAYRDNQCGSLTRGILGLAWANIAVGLFAVGTLAACVSKFGHWSDELRHLPGRTLAHGTTGDIETAQRPVHH